jgi:putative transcriptional regulator
MHKVSTAPVLNDATRAALASGRAEPGVGLFLDSLMEMRGISEREGDILAGAALEAETPAPMHQDALAMAFAAIERGGSAPRARARLVYAELEGLPAGLRDAIMVAEAGKGWAYAGPGIRRLDLGMPGSAKAEIIRLEPGCAVPGHTHKGQELTLCLHGTYTDGHGSYGPGDFSAFDGSVRHRPHADANGPAYALAVTDAGLRFHGLLGVLQKLFGQ